MNNHRLTDLIQSFSPEKLIPLFREKNTTFRSIRQTLEQEASEQFSRAEKLGEIPFSLYENFVICAVQVNANLTERSGKKAQYELAKKILKENQDDAGIFIFYDSLGNFRFSLVYANYLGRKQDWSSFRRFTYFVSPLLTNKTFLNRVGNCDFSSLKEIQDAFSVQIVTDKFFEEFRDVFSKTREEFEEANKNTVCLWLHAKYEQEDYEEQVNKFIFTFLGRIIFLYFLLRKGWIEDRIDFIRSKFEEDSNYNLYQEVLEPLFFEVFAKPEKERPSYIRDQYKNTPYLNGGLFEKSDLESEMAKENKFILFRDEFLRAIILNFFEIYNFTVDENSPNDQEVSIDPEMLGKVFENTLAEKERSKKGTFYTPREVVHFMVKDALRQYLFNETAIPIENLQKFVYDEEGCIDYLAPSQRRLLDDKLENVKILDPAVGSAAFPVECLQVIIELRKRLDVKVGNFINEVSLKKQLIKNNLYGVDIDPGAIEIARLRLWLSLIVDYEKALAEPLPNLDFQFRVGNSLQEKIEDIEIFNETNVGQIDWLKTGNQYEGLKAGMIGIKDQFYSSNDENKRHKLKEEFDSLEHKLIQAVLDAYEKSLLEQYNNNKFSKVAGKYKETQKKILSLEQKIKDGTYKLFKPDFHFSEVFDRVDDQGERIGGFDIVIGNPPYGVKIEKDIQDWHKLGSNDSYGVFISTALKRFLRPKGILEFIISDTWLTIKTHKALRSQVLERQLHKVVRLHQDCFDATVNACVISVTNSEPDHNRLIAADLTNLSTRNQIETLRPILYHLENHIGQSTPNYGVYSYDQKLIQTNSNLPIFVGSPKLFALMQDVGVNTIQRNIGGKSVAVRQIEINGHLVEMVRFGDIAEVKQGLATGDNWAYLFQNPEARGSYRNINEFRQYLLTEEDLLNIATDDNRRMKVIELGIHKSRAEKDFDEDRWFGGRYIVPYDKGGESDTDSGWLPNYYVPTNYFIDWSTWAVNRMKTLTIKERDGVGIDRVCSRFQNLEYYFKEGITFSITGIYAPSFRTNSWGVFDVKGSYIDPPMNYFYVLGVLVSKLIKILSKLYIYNCVDMQVDAIKEIPFFPFENDKISLLVRNIISKQSIDLRYDYLRYEQKEIDTIVYKLYGLNDNDIKEVETWYARRYPKLTLAIDFNID